MYIKEINITNISINGIKMLLDELPKICFVEYRFWEESRIVSVHAHDNLFQLDFFPQGEGTYRIADDRHFISNNSLYFVRPGIPHEICGSTDKPLENMTVKFSLNAGSDFHLPAVLPVDESTARKAGVLFRQVISEGVLSSAEHLTVAACRLVELLVLIKNRDQCNKPDTSAGALVSAAQRFMTEWFANPLSIADIARAAGVSAEHLCRIFKEYTGATPFGFLRMIRFEQAKRILASTTENVASIAKTCGIGDAKNINRLFRRMAGVSPREYRKQAQMKA